MEPYKLMYAKFSGIIMKGNIIVLKEKKIIRNVFVESAKMATDGIIL